jgi:hypothetical protein
MSDATREQLARMLAAAGLPAREEDVEAQLRTTFPVMRAAVETLHAMPEARHEPPAIVFDADPSLEGWHDAEVER